MPNKIDARQVNVNGRRLKCRKCEQFITDAKAVKIKTASAIEVKHPKYPEKKQLKKNGSWKTEYQHISECLAKGGPEAVENA